MKKTLQCYLFWSPRVLAILFALFLSVFALDAFDGENSIWRQIGGFIIHLAPNALLIAVLVLAWRWELIGAIVFPVLGMLYIILAWGKFDWITYLIISGPLFLTGILFMQCWIFRKWSAN